MKTSKYIVIGGQYDCYTYGTADAEDVRVVPALPVVPVFDVGRGER